jgi:serine/threonine protein kinase
MELIDGHSLSDLLQEDSLPVDRALGIVKQVVEAIAEAHYHGIIHRDIKPSNVVVNQRNEVKVLDFGIAKNIEPDSRTTQRIGEAESATDWKNSEAPVPAESPFVVFTQGGMVDTTNVRVDRCRNPNHGGVGQEEIGPPSNKPRTKHKSTDYSKVIRASFAFQRFGFCFNPPLRGRIVQILYCRPGQV